MEVSERAVRLDIATHKLRMLTGWAYQPQAGDYLLNEFSRPFLKLRLQDYPAGLNIDLYTFEPVDDCIAGLLEIFVV